ncbi:MAG: 50S ribosomal protein L17 [Nitrospina sp.]|mgnify:FL=1|jgi:large subunit ribosomal protein L17|nr:50S ribosomal protein L17 [Nitrospina sp.]MBT3510969.1 50S ribosomal protein L17 [Nitrospina sp.]MBT3874402.1 50S ribosomal protein L17 [Nitrospina sp.]MBT4048829.1 50S ribosomal protein L17 [Nitrospina sp.]MBT4558477.1 50S ribosomal protein L17 [Nitrospina sp.]
MRHLKAGRKFGRTSAHRKALFRNLVQALIQKERISTTLAKAKELRGKVEKTITLGKKGTLHARRQAFKLAPDKEAVQKVFGPLAERYSKRPGGYTRIIRIGHRKGDDAPMAFIELVDRVGEEKAPEKTAPKKEAQDAKPKVTEKKKAEPKAAAPKKAKAPADKKKSSPKETPKKDKPEDKEKK